MENKSMTVVCLEYTKHNNRKPILYVVSRNVNMRDLYAMSLGSAYNPKLNYYATTIEGTDDFLIALFKDVKSREKYFVRV